MRISRTILLPLSILAAATAQARADSEAETQALHACFAGPRPAYMVALNYSGLAAQETLKSLTNACKEFDSPKFQATAAALARLVDYGIYSAFAEPLLQAIPTMVEEALGGAAAAKDYVARLREIGKIKNRYERIRKVYELAIASQGRYDDHGESNDFFSTPGSILANVQAGKPGGVCRDFAGFLEWSLMQVNRSPALSVEQRSWGGLDDDSFFVRQVPDTTQAHAWVDVALPVGSGDSQVFYKISLDPTFYETYSPLYQRRTGLSGDALDKARTACYAVADCVEGVTLKYLPQTPAKLFSSPDDGEACVQP